MTWNWSDELEREMTQPLLGCRGILLGALLSFLAVCLLATLIWVVLS